MPAEPITTRDTGDPYPVGWTYLWRDRREPRFWEEVDGWRLSPLDATGYSPTFHQGKPTPPTGPPQGLADHSGRWVTLAGAMAEQARLAYHAKDR